MRQYQVEHFPASEHNRITGPYKERQRPKWGSRPEFFAVLVAVVVNEGILQKFPYYCMRHGGVIFLVPYLLFLLLFTIPLMVMEAGLGQYAGVSAITMWRACPLFKGVGIAVILTILLTTTVSGVSLAWTFYYIFSSASSYIPWRHCYNEWNTASCVSLTIVQQKNLTGYGISSSPGYEYFTRFVLQISTGIGDPGSVNISLLISLAVAWVIILLIVCAGTKSLGKVIYGTVLTSFLLLVVLLIRGLTLPGSFKGLLYFVLPDVRQFLDPYFWLDGCQYAFFTFVAGLAVTATMASYNRFDYNSYRDVLLFPLVAVLANILGGAVVFAFIGFLSERTGTVTPYIMRSGPELSFASMAEAMALLPIPQLWNALYFVLDMMLKLSTQVVLVQVSVSSISDDMGDGQRCWARALALLLVSGVACTLGVACITKGGIYVFYLLDVSSIRLGPYLCAIFQCIGIAWVYGMEQLYQDITLLRGNRPCGLWKVFWCFFSLLLPLAMMVFQMVVHEPMQFKEYIYPLWSRVVSWLISLLPLLIILLGMVFQLEHLTGKGIREVVRPTEEWGPVEGRQRPRFTPSAPPATGTMEMKPPPFVEYERAWAY